MASQGPSDFGQPGPGDESAPYHSGNAYESGGDSNSSKSPLHIGLGFLKGLTEKKTTRDGQPAKRRGPKPDSKPALTRRQELNRQAQRTHRERKELYIKALEQEVLRLKESYAHLNRERDTVIEENIKLKELLRQHGITSFPSGLPLSETQVSGGNTEFGGSSCGSMSETYGGTISSGYSPATGPQTYAAPTNATFSSGQDTVRPEDRARSLSQQQQLPPPHPHPHAARPPQQQGQPQGQQPRLDYDQTGIDFVLTLERPCMDHMQFLLVRAHDGDQEEQFSGHVLMASCPPETHIVEHPDVPYPYDKLQEDPHRPELGKLLQLSQRLNLEGEITPIMAWGMIIGHPRFAELTQKDFKIIKDELKAKVRCYGFGAVLEEFEVRDALSSALATKIESYQVFA